MDKKIEEYLSGRGYHIIPNDAGNEIKVFFRVDQSLASAVILIDARKIILSRQVFTNLKNDVGAMFASKGYANIKIFSIFIVNNSILGKKITQQEEFSWIIDMQAKRLVIYEHQLLDFDNLKAGLEETVDRWFEENGLAEEKLTLWKVFANTVWNNEARITIGLILINILVFAVLSIGGSTLDVAYMMDHGAMFPSYILYKEEYYRLFTCIFLHFGIEHLGANMLSLYIFGERVEGVLGKVKFLILYLVSGLFASCTSLLSSYLMGTEIASAGASGAIFGVIGALFVIIIKDRQRFKELTPARAALMIGYSLFAGITGVGIDNAAHIGGLIAGLILGAIFFRKGRNEK